MVNVPTEWVLEEATRLTINENTEDITFTGSCDIFVVDQWNHFSCPSGQTCLDITSDDISSDLCNNDNVESGTGHNCFAHGTHGAWCGTDGNGNAAVATCEQPFKYVHKIQVRDGTFVYSYAAWTMLVMTKPSDQVDQGIFSTAISINFDEIPIFFCFDF